MEKPKVEVVQLDPAIADYSIHPQNHLPVRRQSISSTFSGLFDWRRKSCCTEVPTNGKCRVEFRALRFTENRDVSVEAVFAALVDHVLRPATFEEIVSFWLEQGGGIIRQHADFIALGTTCRYQVCSDTVRDHCYPSVTLHDNGRGGNIRALLDHVSLNPGSCMVSKWYYFLAVPALAA